MNMAKRGSIQEDVARLVQAVNAAADNFKKLSVRLDLVLLPDRPSTEEKAVEQRERSSVAGHIADISKQVEQLVGEITSVINRLDLEMPERITMKPSLKLSLYTPIEVAVAMSLYRYNVSPQERARRLYDHFNGNCAEMDDLVLLVDNPQAATDMAYPTAKLYVEHALEVYGAEAVGRCHENEKYHTHTGESQ